MKFMLDDMEFVFPYDKMYPEQYNYVCDLKRSLDAHVRTFCSAFTSVPPCSLDLPPDRHVNRAIASSRCRPGRARRSRSCPSSSRTNTYVRGILVMAARPPSSSAS